MTITLAVWWVALTQCTAVSRTRPRSTCWLLYTNCGYSQLTPSTSSQSTSPNFTRLPARHFWLSGLLCCRSDSLYLATGQSPWCGAQQQRFQTIVIDEFIIIIIWYSAVEILHASVLYRLMTDTDIIWGSDLAHSEHEKYGSRTKSTQWPCIHHVPTSSQMKNHLCCVCLNKGQGKAVWYILHRPGSRYCHLAIGCCTIRQWVFDCKYLSCKICFNLLNYVFILFIFEFYCLVNIQQPFHNSIHCGWLHRM